MPPSVGSISTPVAFTPGSCFGMPGNCCGIAIVDRLSSGMVCGGGNAVFVETPQVPNAVGSIIEVVVELSKNWHWLLCIAGHATLPSATPLSTPIVVGILADAEPSLTAAADGNRTDAEPTQSLKGGAGTRIDAEPTLGWLILGDAIDINAGLKLCWPVVVVDNRTDAGPARRWPLVGDNDRADAEPT